MNEAPRNSTFWHYLRVGLWIGLALGLGRTAVALGMDVVAHGHELRTGAWRMGVVLPAALGLGGVVGVASAVVLAGNSKVARALGLGVATVGALWVLSGWSVDYSTRVPGFETARGAFAWAVLSIGSLVLMLLARAWVRRTGAGPGVLALLVPVALGGAAWGGFRAAVDGPPPMRTREIVRALLEEEAWEVRSANPRLEPKVGPLTPVKHWKARGGERPALVLAPGGEVAFDVGDEDVTLHTSVAMDEGNRHFTKRKWEAIFFRFDVLVNGAEAFTHTIEYRREKDRLEYEWIPVGGDEGLALAAGDEVVLKVSARSEPEDPRVADLPWRTGFSDLLLERTVMRPRTLSSPETPNIVLVLQDTQRRDRLGCYGYDKDTSPNLDALAERGILFEEAYSTSSWTWPATTSVLTGLHPEEHGVRDDASCYAPRSLEFLAEALQARGYTTAAFSGSPLIIPSKSFDQGFEFFDGSGEGFRKSHIIVPRALEWVRSFAGQKFFLYLHLVDPHDPHHPLPEAAEKFITRVPEGIEDTDFHDYSWSLRKGGAITDDGGWDLESVVPPVHQAYYHEMYDALVWSGDWWFGEFLDGLDEMGLLDETVIAYTADHGEELFEHGMLEHGHTLHPELSGVPIVIAGPNVPAGVRTDMPVSNRQLAPTLARLGGGSLDRVENALLLIAPSIDQQPVMVSTQYGWWNAWFRTPIHSVRDGSWVLHWAPEAGELRAEEATPGGQFRLYDVEADPEERNDLARVEPERAAELLELLQSRLTNFGARRTSTAIGGGEGTQAMLEGIGYIESDEDEVPVEEPDAGE